MVNVSLIKVLNEIDIYYTWYPLALLIEINLVEVFFGSLIISFFNQLPVAVDIDMKILVEFEYTLKNTNLLFHSLRRDLKVIYDIGFGSVGPAAFVISKRFNYGWIF